MTQRWRFGLREHDFLDIRPDPADVPVQIVNLIEDAANFQALCDKWDEMYPGNPVDGSEDEDAD